MHRARVAACGLSFAGAAAAIVSACLSPTEITLEIRTNLACTDPQPRLEWTTIGVAGRVIRQDAPPCHPDKGSNLVGRLVLVPSGKPGKIDIRVAAHVIGSKAKDATPLCEGDKVGGDCIIARRIAAFVSHSSLTLGIFLDNACLGVDCPPDQTCEHGRCVKADCTMNPALCNSSDAGPDDAGPITPPPIVGLVAGGDGTCSVHEDASVRCWGDNGAGQLAAPPAPILMPSHVVALDGFKALALGSGFGCGIDGADAVSCWGDNTSGRLGRVGTGDEVPIQVIDFMSNPLTAVGTVVAVGEAHACAVGVTASVASPSLWCWGSNASQQIAAGTDPNFDTAQPLQMAVSAIALGSQHTCVVDNKVLCWGGNQAGQCGATPSATPKTSPVTVVTGQGANLSATVLSAGEAFTCGRDSANVWCWGANDHVQVGSAPDGGATFAPLRVTAAPPFGSLVSGGAHSCVISGMTASCWGASDRGQSGILATSTTPIPANVNVDLVAVGKRHTCVATKKGTEVRCFGANDKGQLGRTDMAAYVDASGAVPVVFTN